MHLNDFLKDEETSVESLMLKLDHLEQRLGINATLARQWASRYKHKSQASYSGALKEAIQILESGNRLPIL